MSPKYITNTFIVRHDRNSKDFVVENPTPPVDGNYRLVNFQPVKSADNSTTVFACVWEEE